jgi:hypothetical protein
MPCTAPRPSAISRARRKTALLLAEYGPRGFVYVGDSRADLSVWSEAAEAITVGAERSVRRAVDAMGRPALHIPARAGGRASMLRALAPASMAQEPAGLRADHRRPGPWRLGMDMGAAAFAALSLAASAGYIINDLLDLSDDRTHPRKRNRPFARGDLSVATGTRMVPVLLLLALAVASLVSAGLVVAVIYFALTMAYSLG